MMIFCLAFLVSCPEIPFSWTYLIKVYNLSRFEICGCIGDCQVEYIAAALLHLLLPLGIMYESGFNHLLDRRW